MAKIFIPKEFKNDESRIPLMPETVKKLIKQNHSILIESGSGIRSFVSDNDYLSVGAEIITNKEEAYLNSDIIIKINPPNKDELKLFNKKVILISFSSDDENLKKNLKDNEIIHLSVDLIPRTTLAQMMDVLSSQSSIAGYRAVILAAENSSKLFPLMMTAAGTIPPVKLLVMGCGVAGLQAIATAKRLGAIVEGYDVRKVVKEQVESLGAKFINIDIDDGAGKGGYAMEMNEDQKNKQKEALSSIVSKQDIIITTAMIPKKKSPILITEEMIKKLKPGSIIVDIAAERGGNCELTKPGQRYTTENDVLIIGDVNLPSQMSYTSSTMYSRNMEKLINHITTKEGTISINLSDEIIKSMIS